MRSLREAIAGAPTALLAGALAVIVLGAGLFGFAIAELTRDEAAPPARPGAAAPAEGPAVVGGQDQPGPVPSWPRDLTAHTVVLTSSPERADALSVARAARSSGLDAGILRSAAHGLGAGGWIVWSGHFASRAGAVRQAEQLSARYPEARAELVQSAQ
jgi:hypothetical protein